jgi:enediyne biosynthesis protein E4
VKIRETLERAKDPFPLHERKQLFRNLGTGRFEEVTAQAGAVFDLSEVGRGAAFGDVDNDGDVDVLVTNNNGPVRLFINRFGQSSRWLGLRLVGGSTSLTADSEPGRRVGGPGPRDMLGARVGVFRNEGPTLWRRARADGSYASANDPRVLVGLGNGATIRWVRVVWPSGRVEDWADIAVDKWITLKEGSGVQAPRNGL